MPLLLIVLLLVIVVFAFGFLVHLLFYAAVILGLVWLIGFFVRGSQGARWYRR